MSTEDPSRLLLTTNRNYMKRAPSSGSKLMQGPSNATDPGFSDLTIPHGVKDANGNPIVPLFRVFYEPWQDGRLIEAFKDTDDVNNANPVDNVTVAGAGPCLFASADNTNLYLSLSWSPSLGDGTDKSSLAFPVYYIIYQDYGVAL